MALGTAVVVRLRVVFVQLAKGFTLNPYWHLQFFSDVALDFWRDVIPAHLTEAEVLFLEAELHLEAGDSVLDVPCGEGRHALALARKGYRVTGVDTSKEALCRARDTSTREELVADWIEADMCDLAVNTRFDAAYCFGNSFGYLDSLRAQRFVAGISASLVEGGRFAIDTGMVAESILPNLPRNRWHRISGMFMLSENEYDAATSRLDITYTFISGGVTDTRPSSSYVLTTAKLFEFSSGPAFAWTRCIVRPTASHLRSEVPGC